MSPARPDFDAVAPPKLPRYNERERLNLAVHRYPVIADGDVLYFSDLLCAADTASDRQGVLLRPDGSAVPAQACRKALGDVEYMQVSRETKVEMVRVALGWPAAGSAAVKEGRE